MDGEIVVRKYDSALEAELAANYLREHGFSPRVDNDVLVGMNPLWGMALGGVRLYVREHQAEAAAKLLAELAASRHATLDDDDGDREPGPDPYRTRAGEDQRSEDAQVREDERAANRALTAAFVGIFLLPVLAHLYSLKIAIPLTTRKLSPRAQRELAFAVTIDVLVLGLLVYLLVSTISTTPVEGRF